MSKKKGGSGMWWTTALAAAQSLFSGGGNSEPAQVIVQAPAQNNKPLYLIGGLAILLAGFGLIKNRG